MLDGTLYIAFIVRLKMDALTVRKESPHHIQNALPSGFQDVHVSGCAYQSYVVCGTSHLPLVGRNIIGEVTQRDCRLEALALTWFVGCDDRAASLCNRLA